MCLRRTVLSAAITASCICFDVEIADGPSYRESDEITGGDRIALVDTELCTLGLSICYDLRFPGTVPADGQTGGGAADQLRQFYGGNRESALGAAAAGQSH